MTKISKEKRRIYNQNYYQNMSPEQRERRKEYMREYQKRYRQANQNRYREYQRTYHREYRLRKKRLKKIKGGEKYEY